MTPAIAEPRASRAGQPGTSAIAGNRTHMATTTPTTPASIPNPASTRPSRTRLTNVERWEPTKVPRSWPTNAAPRRRPADARNAVGDEGESAGSTRWGSSQAPTASPATIPAHDSTRRANPSRHPTMPASTPTTTTTRSRRFTAASAHDAASAAQETRVRDHPMVGSHGLALDVPAAVEHLDGLGQREAPGLVERVA